MKLKQFKVFNLFKKRTGFFDLSQKEKERVIGEAARGANRDQRELVEKYERETQKA